MRRFVPICDLLERRDTPSEIIPGLPDPSTQPVNGTENGPPLAPPPAPPPLPPGDYTPPTTPVV